MTSSSSFRLKKSSVTLMMSVTSKRRMHPSNDVENMLCEINSRVSFFKTNTILCSMSLCIQNNFHSDFEDEASSSLFSYKRFSWIQVLKKRTRFSFTLKTHKSFLMMVLSAKPQLVVFCFSSWVSESSSFQTCHWKETTKERSCDSNRNGINDKQRWIRCSVEHVQLKFCSFARDPVKL